MIYSSKNALKFIVYISLVVFVMLEIALSTYFAFIKKDYRGVTQFSSELGWVTGENLSIEKTYPNYGNIKFTTQNYGFRQFGDPNNKRLKLLVLGDSQTLSIKVSDGETYQEHIAENLNMELFAYGGGGYGTLQQYIVLQKYYALIKPDIVILQFCGNDLHNNLLELESSSWKRNNHMIRPYLVESNIKMMYPHPSILYRNVFRHSKVLKIVGVNIEKQLWEIQQNPEKFNLDHPLISESIQTTSEIVGMIRQTASNSLVFSFLACRGRHYPKINMEKLFRVISERNNVVYISGVTKALNQAEENGKTVNGLPLDAHWNALGNKIAASVIIKKLRQNGIVNSHSDK